MKTYCYIFLVLVFSLTSCKKEEESNSNATIKSEVPFTQLPTSEQNQVAQPSTQQKHNLFNNNESPAVVATSPNRSNSSIMASVNPAHGQPNHRCDIPVGAPLSQKVSIASTTPQQTPKQTNSVVTVPTSLAAVTPKGVNPPHGQKNHRCDIAVGAPLNSKPVAPASNAVTPETKTPSIPDVLAASPNSVEKVVTPEGINPPHGQDKHRCDIAVGDPLPKQ